jgi:hypothetical protein
MSTEQTQRSYRKYAVRIEFTLPDMGVDDDYVAEYIADTLSDSRLGEYVDAVTDTDIDELIVAVGSGTMAVTSNAVTQ